MRLEYRPAPELVRMHEQFSIELAKQKRDAQASKNLRGTEVMQRLLPLIEASIGFSAGIQGDLAGYIDQVAAEPDSEEAIFGIDQPTADDIDTQLKEVIALVTEMGNASNNGAKKSSERAIKLIGEVREVIQELVLGEIEEGEEPLDYDEEGDDEPLEIEE